MRLSIQCGFLVGVVAAVALLFSNQVSLADHRCPLCPMQGSTTLAQEIGQASMVLFGTITNAQLGGNGNGQADLQIEAVIKDNEFLEKRKLLTLPRFIPAVGAKQKWLIFCDVFKGQLDPYRGIPVQADAEMAKYLQGAIAVNNKPLRDRLKFYFDYLDNPEIEISTDAYKEFANAEYKDVRTLAVDLAPDRIAKWLQDPNTATFRYGLYALLLGHCGKEKHAEVFASILRDPATRKTSGIDGILAGYILLRPQSGWRELQAIVSDANQEFLLRYAALRTMRFLWDYRRDVIADKDLVQVMTKLLEQSDIADLAIEDLRKWNRFEVCDLVLSLHNRKSHDVPIIRRSILRYALSCSDAKAIAFVAEYRKRDPETVKDTEELLKLEPSKNP